MVFPPDCNFFCNFLEKATSILHRLQQMRLQSASLLNTLSTQRKQTLLNSFRLNTGRRAIKFWRTLSLGILNGLCERNHSNSWWAAADTKQLSWWFHSTYQTVLDFVAPVKTRLHKTEPENWLNDGIQLSGSSSWEEIEKEDKMQILQGCCCTVKTS